MTTDELWDLIKDRLDKIEQKLDKANGRSQRNAWNIKALWGVVSAEFGLFVWWLKSRFG